ncbi:MAG: aminotransferase class V-fold PLP-dependent enzyme, partial [Thermomicrobiales bacterium]|nr:aminotransferase class V-fold PLP-dependent enzyme [Thermomicrobiales bacterium]
WDIAPEAIAAQVDGRTRLVFLSHVSYRTGTRIDLERAAELIRQRNPTTIVAADATQSLGVVPVPADACDFVVVTTCKWLLGPHGLGVLYWNRRRMPSAEPAGIGWFSVVDDLQFPYELKPDAGRFELGGPNMLGIYALNEGVQLLLQTGIARITDHVLALSGHLRERAAALGLPVMTPSDADQRAGIVAWEDRNCKATAARLAEEGVLVSGSSGRIRAAIHLYTDRDEVDALVMAMASFPAIH